MLYARHPQRVITAAVLLLVLVSSGCVRSSTFRREMAQVREEVRAGDADVDRRLSSRIDALEQRMLTLEQELGSLETEFGATVERFEQALRVHAPIHFGFDEARIESDQTAVLDRLSAVLSEYYPQALLTVEGFTDPAGSAAYNLRLGQRRADEVRAYLLTRGWLAEPQIRAVSYGEDDRRLIRPDAFGPDAGMENRRVVIVIDHPNTWPANRVTMTTSSEGTH